MSRPGDLPQQLWGWSIPSVLIDICNRSGIPFDRIDIDRLEGSVDGFSMDATKDAYSGIEALASVYLFDSCNYDGQLTFLPRGEDVVAELTLEDLVDDGEEIEKSTRRDSISVPRVLHLEYLDTNGGLTPDKQTSDRSLDARSKSEVKAETTVIMRAQDAARSVVIRHKLNIEEQRGPVEFSLPDSWCWLSCGDVITLEGERLRIDEVSIDDGFQSYKCAHDRKSAYQSTVEGIPIQEPSTPPTLIVGDTVLHFIDSHILRDADDILGYYVAISSASAAWFGAGVDLSLDGGETYIESITATAWADIGELTEALPLHSASYPDEVNTLTVRMLRPDDTELESATLAGMQNRLNLAIVGDELINFGDVDELSPGVWAMTNLLRGRKGSTVAAHAAGERFIVLRRDDLYLIDADLFQLGRPLTFRATSINGSNPIVSSYLFTGKSQTERQPAYLQVSRSGGNLTATWQGVGRLGGGASVAMGSRFAGFRLTVNGVSTDTLASTLTVADPGGTATVSVQQLNQLTGAGPALTVIA